jgi:hypothetical protein
MDETSCSTCHAAATAKCELCGKPSCAEHLKTVVGLGDELVGTFLFGSYRLRSREELTSRACIDCHKKLRRQNISRLLVVLVVLPALLLVCAVAVGLLARHFWPP